MGALMSDGKLNCTRLFLRCFADVVSNCVRRFCEAHRGCSPRWATVLRNRGRRNVLRGGDAGGHADSLRGARVGKDRQAGVRPRPEVNGGPRYTAAIIGLGRIGSLLDDPWADRNIRDESWRARPCTHAGQFAAHSRIQLIAGADGAPKLYRMFRPADKQRVIGDDYNHIRTFEALPGRLYAARFNHDGTRIVVASSLDGHGEARVYDTETGSRVAAFSTDQGGLFAVTFDPTGTQVAVAGFDGRVRLLDAESGAVVKEFWAAPLQSDPVAAK